MAATNKERAQAHREGAVREAQGKASTTIGQELAGSTELNKERERGAEDMAQRIEQRKEDQALDSATT